MGGGDRQGAAHLQRAFGSRLFGRVFARRPHRAIRRLRRDAQAMGLDRAVSSKRPMTYPVELTRRRFLQRSVAGSLALAGFGHPAHAQAARPMRTFSSGEDALIWSVAFSPDGRTIVSGSSNGNVIFWEVSTGKRLRTPESRSSLNIHS